jgi:hypothetical protein
VGVHNPAAGGARMIDDHHVERGCAHLGPAAQTPATPEIRTPSEHGRPGSPTAFLPHLVRSIPHSLHAPRSDGGRFDAYARR